MPSIDSRILGQETTRRVMLRDFLQSRRAKLSPDDVGLAWAGRRHTRGLRREEVAVLSGVSVSWYTWLEQGREIKVSDSVLDAISVALRLNDSERTHLYRLAGVRPPTTESQLTVDDLEHLQRVVNGWLPAPAYVFDRYWNILSANAFASSVIGVAASSNYVAMFFTDPRAKHYYPRWDEMADQLVGKFRAQVARYPDDPQFGRIIRRLIAVNARFAELWPQHEVWDHTLTRVDVRLPSGAIQTFEYVEFGLLERADLRVKLYLPVAGVAPERQFERLTG
jgi:transcriptional regulator with XRE-family HTH domain